MVAAFTIAMGSSIGLGFASATELMATSNATGIQGFIGGLRAQRFAMSDLRLRVRERIK